jgi:hypothetical protein
LNGNRKPKETLPRKPYARPVLVAYGGLTVPLLMAAPTTNPNFDGTPTAKGMNKT